VGFNPLLGFGSGYFVLRFATALRAASFVGVLHIRQPIGFLYFNLAFPQFIN
jgi:hypothetical protein